MNDDERKKFYNLVLLEMTLLVAKSTDNIKCSWWLVLMPLFIVIVVFIIALMISYIGKGG